MLAGKLDRKILVQSVTNPQNTFGEAVKTYTDFWETNASVRSLSGREFFEAQAVHAEEVLEFTTRFKEGVKREMRLVYNDVNYDIINVSEIGRKVGLKLLAKALVE